MAIMIEPDPVTKDERHGVFLGNLTVIEEKSRNAAQIPSPQRGRGRG